MDNGKPIDITFNFRSDTPPAKDPDALSPTLRRYHRLLWSKPLSSGVVFDLVDTMPNVYLHHRSQLGEFQLASDAVIPTFRKQKHIKHILDQIPEELRTFGEIGLHDWRDDGVPREPGWRPDDNQRCTRVSSADQGPVRSYG